MLALGNNHSHPVQGCGHVRDRRICHLLTLPAIQNKGGEKVCENNSSIGYDLLGSTLRERKIALVHNLGSRL